MSPDDIIATYTRLLEAWNRRDATGFAALFTTSGIAIGFDGSQMPGRSEIVSSLVGIFAHHRTSSYVARVRAIQPLGADVAILHAVVGMVPPGKSGIEPAVNAVHTMVIMRDGAAACIALLQSTPAAFHGRPQLGEQLTAELTEVARSGAIVAAAK